MNKIAKRKCVFRVLAAVFSAVCILAAVLRYVSAVRYNSQLNDEFNVRNTELLSSELVDVYAYKRHCLSV